MNLLFYFTFIIITSHLSTEKNNYYKINLNDYNINQKTASEPSLITITLEVAFGWAQEDPLFKKIIHSITTGNQIKASLIPHNNNKKLLYTELASKNIQFYISLHSENNKLIWKLYSVFDKKFIKGKAYQYQKDSPQLLRTIMIDIWQELFGESITPYNSFLAYLDTSFDNKIQETHIQFCHPLLSGFEKTIFKSNHNILDLASIDSKPMQSLLFSTQNNCGTGLIKLTSRGDTLAIMNNNKMLISPTVNQDGLFYINSGLLYRYYYNKKEQKFCNQLLDTSSDFASVYAINTNHAILISKNKQIYKIEYQVNHENNELILMKGKKITENKLNSTNMTYDYSNNTIIVSQKINGFFQLVSYDDSKKEILTCSPYHKQDPAISPCGNYIAYIAQTGDGERYIEVMNKYSSQTIRVTISPGEYRFPVWLIR